MGNIVSAGIWHLSISWPLEGSRAGRPATEKAARHSTVDDAFVSDPISLMSRLPTVDW